VEHSEALSAVALVGLSFPNAWFLFFCSCKTNIAAKYASVIMNDY